jgi:hypothetical protein
MKVYVIAAETINDSAMFDLYRKEVPATLVPFGFHSAYSRTCNAELPSSGSSIPQGARSAHRRSGLAEIRQCADEVMALTQSRRSPAWSRLS